MNYKLGKLPARPDSITFKLATYAKLPTPPPYYNHDKLIPTWGMYGNDRYGDCVIAGGAHETMVWNKEANKIVRFTDLDVLSDYSAITGFNPNDPNTDRGTDVQVAASYRRKIGLRAHDGRHKVYAYLNVQTGNQVEVMQAVYLFSAIGIGFAFPDYAMDQFNKGQPWTVARGGRIIGYHYVPIIGYDATFFYSITWGKLQKMSRNFFQKYNDESVAYLSQEFLINNKSLEHFDFATLQSNLKALA